VSPILGIWASSIQPSLNATSFDSIATVTASGSTSTINFTSIPSTYTHLQLRFIARDAGANGAFGIKYNSDTTASNYYRHYLYGDGASVSAGASSTSTDIFAIPYSGTTANAMGIGIVDILDYANTSKYKTLRCLNGDDLNGSGQIHFESTLWKNTNAITSINLVMQGGSNFTSTSTFALYGIK